LFLPAPPGAGHGAWRIQARDLQRVKLYVTCPRKNTQLPTRLV